MNEKPIERLNYYNGQRLEADDLKLEQEYHIRVRRWLNKSLYSAGIAKGLEVRRDPGNLQQLIVSPGLALDYEGREIILLEEQHFDVVGKPSKIDGQVEGNYLTIEYREERRNEESDCCTPLGKDRNKGQLAWGGPSRVRATPILGWSDIFPHECSGKIVLAQVELSEKCEVRHVYAYPRRYVGPTSLTTVRQFALEGERHIDATNPGRIYFHIRGRQPNAVTLYLRAEKFSTLFYTEMGNHVHASSPGEISTPIYYPDANKPDKYKHKHSISQHNTESSDHDPNNDGKHDTHGFYTRYSGTAPGAIQLCNFTITVLGQEIKFGDRGARGDLLRATDDNDPEHYIHSTITDGHHSHMIPAKDTSLDLPFSDDDHKHTFTPGAMGAAGVNDKNARSGQTEEVFTFVENLQVYIGAVGETGIVPDPLPETDNHTNKILEQLRNAQPTVTWDKLGGGRSNPNHPLVQKGTGEIRLNLLSPNLSFPEGQYYIDLSVASGGGRILYNLYVE